MRRVLQESDIRTGLGAGGRIESVVIVARRDEAGGVEHVPYLLPSWRRGYIAIGLFRGDGVRAYRDLTRFCQMIGRQFGSATQVAAAKAPQSNAKQSCCDILPCIAAIFEFGAVQGEDPGIRRWSRIRPSSLAP